MLVEIHALQSFGPSNLNRDDTGNPKDVMFGGTRRMRISSQAQKRPIRLSNHFRETTGVAGAVRTKLLSQTIAEGLVANSIDSEQAESLATAFVEQIAGIDKKNGLSSVLVYIAPAEHERIVSQLAEAARGGNKEVKATVGGLVKELAKDKHRITAPDLALFGRMLANNPELNVDAAAQVAHAISTHTSVTEFDYFTAVDDLAPKDQTGASMIGIIPFASATYYRYARVDVDLLRANLAADAPLTKATVTAFLRAFLYALPTGKQNTFAAHNLPEFVIGVVRPDNQGWSLANAFEAPVRPTQQGGYMEPSIKALTEHWLRMEQTYSLTDPVTTTILSLHDRSLSIPENLALNLSQTASARAWLETMASAIPGGA